jgi:hypothetical protein
MRLTWESRELWRLLMKRALNSCQFQDWCSKAVASPELTAAAVETAGELALHPYLDRLFDHHIWTGKSSLSRNWILRRLADAKGVIYPRDLICLLRESLGKESDRINESIRVSEASVISRQSLPQALTPTSRQRVDAVKEEYPDLGTVLELMRGLDARGEIESLRERIGVKELNLLSEAGAVRLDEWNYVVPDLYRHGLDMPRKGPS